MNSNDFRDALSEIGNSADIQSMAEAVAKKRKNTVKITILSAAAVFVVAAVAGVILIINSGNNKVNGGSGNGPVLVADTPSPAPESTDGEGALDTPEAEEPTPEVNSAEPTALPTEEPTETPEPTPEPHYLALEPFWAKGEVLSIRNLGYDLIAPDIVSLEGGSISAKFIPTTVFGEHETCGKLYYNTETGAVFCVYHEFLKASGIEIPEDCAVYYLQDTVREDLICIMIEKRDTLELTDLWLFDMDDGTAARVELPAECESYAEINVYTPGLYNGRLALSVNGADDKHFVSVFNSATGEHAKMLENIDQSHISATFLAENVILISKADGNYAYNTDTGSFFNVVGEHNICFDGLIYSVKNWWGAFHTEVKVAVYDAGTGEKVENRPVLVLTVLDDGSRAIIRVDSDTGEETVIIDQYDERATAWSKDYAYFYAYSSKYNKVLCYSVSSGDWTVAETEPLEKGDVEIDGERYFVFDSYSIAVDENCKDVTLYYTRTVEKLQEIPGYEDERVDSPYWDMYREIKALNGLDQTTRWFVSYKEDRTKYGWYGHDVSNMEVLRDIILKCLEGRGELIDYNLTEQDYDDVVLYISYGTFRMYFLEKNGQYYLSLCANMAPPRGFVEEYSGIPEALYKEIVDMHTPYVIFTWMSPGVRIDDGDETGMYIVINDEQKSYVHGIVDSGRWETNAFSGIQMFREACVFLDGEKIYGYEPFLGVILDMGEPIHIKLTEEECAAIEAMINY